MTIQSEKRVLINATSHEILGNLTKYFHCRQKLYTQRAVVSFGCEKKCVTREGVKTTRKNVASFPINRETPWKANGRAITIGAIRAIRNKARVSLC